MNPTAHWMYNIKTGVAKLFDSVEDYIAEEWANTPDLCESQEDMAADRDSLKALATELGIEFPSNIKTSKLIELIASAKEGTEQGVQDATI